MAAEHGPDLGELLDAVVAGQRSSPLAGEARARLARAAARIRFQLESGRADGDPGARAVGLLLERLSAHLCAPAADPPAPGRTADPEARPASAAERLRALVAEIARTESAPLRHAPDDRTGTACWERVHLHCLLLAPEQAERIRGRLASAFDVPAGGTWLVPACPTLGSDGWDGVPALRAELLAEPGPDGDWWPELVGLVATMLDVAARLPGTRVGHQSRAGNEPVPFGADEHADFVTKARSWARMVRAPGSERSAVEALLAFDELARALIPYPIPDARSWWCACRDRATELVRARAHQLGGRLTTVREGDRVAGNPQINWEERIRVKQAAARDTVLLVLRHGHGATAAADWDERARVLVAAEPAPTGRADAQGSATSRSRGGAYAT